MVESDRTRGVAARLLAWLAERGLYRPGEATPVDALVGELGLDVVAFHPASRREGTLGWLEPDEPLIYLREDLPEPVRRFTLAHELGHAVLHRPGGLRALTGEAGGAGPSREVDGGDSAVGCDDADLELLPDALAGGDELLRPGEAYSARAQREGEANSFASALLMPPDAVRDTYLRLAHRYSGESARRSVVRALADRFGVSEDVALRQLTALLLSPEVAAAGSAAPVVESVRPLDPWQRAAATSETPALVVAGPGTGKTSTLVGRVAYLVRERGVRPGGILALTFSNKAAREMRDRLAALLASAEGGEATSNAPELPFVSTIHAFCGDLLRRYGPRVGLRPDFRLVSELEGYFLLRRLSSELALRHYQPIGAPGLHYPALLNAISRAKDELAGPEEYAAAAEELARRAATPEEREAAERAAEVAAVYASYQRALAERGDPDFGDVVRLAVRLLREHPDVLAEVRARYGQILVDEFQDINRAMGVLLRALVGDDGPLWAVGDADQAIYRFRGASPANIARFDVEYPAARVHTLRRNYRSFAPVLEAAAGVAGRFIDERHGEPLEAARGDGPATVVRLAAAPDEAAELAGLARAIGERHSAGRALAEQAVLCRTRRHAQRVAASLNRAGIPARLVSPLLEQDAVKDVLAVVSLLAESSGSGLLRAGRVRDHAFAHADVRTLLTRARAQQLAPIALVTRHGLAGLAAELTPEGARGLAVLAEILAELRQAPGVGTGLARYVFGLTRLGARLLAEAATDDQDACARAMQMAQLLLLARAFDDQRPERAGGDASARAGADWAGFLDYMRVVGLLRQEGAGAVDDALAALGDGVRVLTVHASKGLEFPVVYLPGLADRRFPSQRRADMAPLPPTLDAEAASEAAPHAHLLEEACLFYVAVTRARDELVLSHAERYGRMRYKPSPFLAPIRERLGERLAVESWMAPHFAYEPRDAGEAEPVPLPPADAPGAGKSPLTTDGALRPSAIETYVRCPRQYAYRYVYGLRPREIGVATLRRSLHETLRMLQARAADARRTSADVTDAPEGADTQHLPPVQLSLAEALELFDANWSAALTAERKDQPEGEAALAELGAEPFEEVYRRHGREVVEQLWAQLADGADPARRGQPEYERTVTVRVGAHDVEVTLDRVERAGAAADVRETAGARRGERGGRQGDANGEPVRFVRHRLGRAKAPEQDLRTLFYALAAEQSGGPRAVEMVEHNLSTGDVEPLSLDARRRARLTEQLHDALDGIRRGDFTPRPDPNVCQNCPFLLICPS